LALVALVAGGASTCDSLQFRHLLLRLSLLLLLSQFLQLLPLLS